jgi:hypothetical protein
MFSRRLRDADERSTWAELPTHKMVNAVTLKPNMIARRLDGSVFVSQPISPILCMRLGGSQGSSRFGQPVILNRQHFHAVSRFGACLQALQCSFLDIGDTSRAIQITFLFTEVYPDIVDRFRMVVGWSHASHCVRGTHWRVPDYHFLALDACHQDKHRAKVTAGAFRLSAVLTVNCSTGTARWVDDSF